MAFRGSGEDPVAPQSYKSQKSNGYEGPTLQRLLREYAYSDSYDASLAGVPIVGLSIDDGYDPPEVDVMFEASRFFPAESRIYQGATDGAIAAIRKVGEFQRAQPSNCPTTRWVLVGYSQGAMAARWTFEALRSRVASLYLLGDPFQKPNAPGTTGKGANGQGVYRFNWQGIRAELDRYYTIKPSTAMSFCHDNDVICDLGPYGIGEHTNYFTTPAEKKQQGRLLAGIVKAAVKGSGSSTSFAKQVEVMFAVDTTGSMDPYIEGAVEAAASIGQKVLGTGPGGRVGLVEYRDHGDDFVARTVVPLTRDVGRFQRGLTGLYADGGGDTPEAVYSGIIEAARAGWSSGTVRAIAVLGDAPAHDPEPVTGYTAASVTRYLKSLGLGVTPRRAVGLTRTAADAVGGVSSDAPRIFGLSSDYELTGQLDSIISEVGGQNYEIGEDGSVAELMNDVVAETVAAPQAALHVSPSLTGHLTVISAAATIVSARPATFQFDLDGDGTYEVSNDRDTQAVVLPAGAHTFGVRVTDAEGRVGHATAKTVTTDARTTLTPPRSVAKGVRWKPRRAVAGRILRVRVPHNDSAHVAWLSPAAGKAQGHKVLAAASSSGPGPMLLRVPRKTKPGRYLLHVIGDDATKATKRVRVVQRPRLRVRVRAHVDSFTIRVRASSPKGRPRGVVAVVRRGHTIATARMRHGRARVAVPRPRLGDTRKSRVKVVLKPTRHFARAKKKVLLRNGGRASR